MQSFEQDNPQNTPYLGTAPLVPPLPTEEEQTRTASEAAQIRIAVAQMTQEGAQRGNGFLPTLWAAMFPLLVIGMAIAFVQGEWAISFLLAFLVATANKFSKLTAENEALWAALSHQDVTPRWIGALTEALHWPAPRAHRVAANLLIRLLPQTSSEDWALLTLEQRTLLFSMLEPRHIAKESNLIIALLKGLERNQDTSALPYLESLVDISAWAPARAKVRLAARACQAALEAKERELAAQISAKALEQAGETAPTVSAPQEKVPPELEALIQEIRERQQKKIQPGMRLGFYLATWGIIIPFTAWNMMESYHNTALGMTALWGVATLLATQLYRLTLFPGQMEHMQKLAQYDSVKGVGFLADALEWPETSLKTAAAAALVRLLPRLRASDANLLNEKQRATLYRKLSMGSVRQDFHLILAILKALEQVGDLSAVGYVEKLANAHAITSNQKRVKQAAAETLPFLQRRAEQNQNSQVLLRASHYSETPPDQLLRPASNQETPSDQLLRPRSNPED